MIRHNRIPSRLTPCLPAFLALCVSLSAFGFAATPTIWNLNSLTSIGGYTPEVHGNPQVVTIDSQQAIQFDGVDDGLIMPVSLLQGVTTFTLEILVHPDVVGSIGHLAEPRYFHVQDTVNDTNRMTLEMRGDGETWYHETYVKRGATLSWTLIDPLKRHSFGLWHHVAATYDGATLAHYVDGVFLQQVAAALTPLAAGKTSLGIRLNLVNPYKGAIAWVRMTPALLEPEEFTGVPNYRTQAAPFCLLY